MALTNEYIQEQLTAKFGEQVYAFSTANGMLSFESAKDLNLKVMQFLYDEPSLGFTFFNGFMCGKLSRQCRRGISGGISLT